MNRIAVTIGAMFLASWIAAAQEVPRVGAYLGYDYVRFNSATNIPAFSANGGGGQVILNFNNWLSGVGDLGAVHKSAIGAFHGDTTIGNLLIGPRFTLRKSHHVHPYFQILWGVAHATTSSQIEVMPVYPQPVVGGATVIPGQAVTARLLTSDTGFGMTVGGGIDIKISKHVTFRPIGVDYYLTRLTNLRTADDKNQNNLRYSAGLAFWFGGPKAAILPPAPPPPTKVCPNGNTIPANSPCPKMDLTLALNVSPSELCPGDSTVVVPNIGGAPQNQLNFDWSLNGQKAGQYPTFEFSSANRQPGNYNVALTVEGDNYNPSSAQTAITLREYRPPAGTAQANPAQIRAGDTSAISASFQGQCGGAIHAPTFEASEGSMRGDQFDSTTVQFDGANNAEQRKTVTITAKAVDNRSFGTATTTVEVVKAAVVVPIRLPDVLFSANSARVNNCGKRILLEQLRAYAERDSTGTVVLVGHSSSDETAANLAQERALNAAAVITAGTGICLSIPQSQVQVSSPGVEQNGVSFETGFCQSSVGAGASTATAMRRVEVWFVPTGGQLPASVTNNQAATALPVSSLGCPK
jgi:outer membrane protein OmpA-like peptidoglycan-associated protein